MTDLQAGASYQPGDVIGQKYGVYGVLGKGGCGVVYLVYSHETGGVFALKTFLDKYLADPDIRKRFQKEANVWVELGQHPNLVHAGFVDEVSGRLYIAMEYIAPNEEGLNTLEGYLQRKPPNLAQSLRWAIQVCHGMDYAYSKGVRAHRDLKPANIMISQDMTAKITDFGLAGILSESPAILTVGLGGQTGRIGLPNQTRLGTGFGTPTHMAPEQFDNATGCDERSDIYSFGIMLYQMASGGRLPFPVTIGTDYWQGLRQLHHNSPVPRLDSPLFPTIQRCLEKSPGKRYQTFQDVRKDLDLLLQDQIGEVIIPSQEKELNALELCNKGLSLNNLGRYVEAMHCLEKALELDPRSAATWNNKGISLGSLSRDEEAINCFDKALELNPQYIAAWSNKGASLSSLGRDEEAIYCFDKTLVLDPRDVLVRINKGVSLYSLGRYEESIHCYDKALELDPCHLISWYNKALAQDKLNLRQEAVRSYKKFLAMGPQNTQQIAHADKRIQALEGG
jgi:eukaryotic-like serine/threonine-protein kinase